MKIYIPLLTRPHTSTPRHPLVIISRCLQYHLVAHDPSLLLDSRASRKKAVHHKAVLLHVALKKGQTRGYQQEYKNCALLLSAAGVKSACFFVAGLFLCLFFARRACASGASEPNVMRALPRGLGMLSRAVILWILLLSWCGQVVVAQGESLDAEQVR